ncbi:MAG: hypothetical protein WCC37_03430 [Candidatus Sulfotelmatobacter sp.]|jgi:hypothetical protein
METYKLHIKIGQHEFQGEGPEETVKKSFEDWKFLMSSLPAAEISKPAAAQSQVVNGSMTPRDGDLLAKMFVLDEKRGLVTLRILPRGDDREADAALLVLFGFHEMKAQDEVLVTQLKPALKQSGCNINRVDAVVAKYQREGLINKGGSGKGGKYSLTNSGLEKAAAIARGLF